MLSVVHGVLLKPLPYGDPDRLVWMYGSFRGSDSAAVSPPDFVDYRNRTEVFERLGAMAISRRASRSRDRVSGWTCWSTTPASRGIS
jgi:hypothetical protein